MKGNKILVAEDDGSLRNLVAQALTEAGFQVFQAVDGVQALKILMENPEIPLLLSDVRMPRMDGYDLAERALALNSELKILMLTAYAEEQPPPSALRARELRVLRKPFDLDKLCEVIGGMLARP